MMLAALQLISEETAKAILDFNGSGLSVLEVSHRGKDFQAVMDEAVALFKEILNIPEGYSVLFLGGGASMQFCMVPYNFLEKKAAYLNTGREKISEDMSATIGTGESRSPFNSVP